MLTHFLAYSMVNDTDSEIRPWKFIRSLISLYIEISFYRSPVKFKRQIKQCAKFGPGEFDLTRGNCILTC